MHDCMALDARSSSYQPTKRATGTNPPRYHGRTPTTLLLTINTINTVYTASIGSVMLCFRARRPKSRFYFIFLISFPSHLYLYTTPLACLGCPRCQGFIVPSPPPRFMRIIVENTHTEREGQACRVAQMLLGLEEVFDACPTPPPNIFSLPSPLSLLRVWYTSTLVRRANGTSVVYEYFVSYYDTNRKHVLSVRASINSMLTACSSGINNGVSPPQEDKLDDDLRKLLKRLPNSTKRNLIEELGTDGGPARVQQKGFSGGSTRRSSAPSFSPITEDTPMADEQKVGWGGRGGG